MAPRLVVVSAQQPPWVRALVVILSYGLVLGVGLVMIFPFLFSIANSFKEPAAVLARPQELIPSPFTLQGYQYLVTGQANFLRWTLNSALVALAVMVGRIVLDSLAGYALARLEFRGRNGVFLLIIGTLMIPAIVLIIPRFIVLKQLGMLGTYQGLIVPFAADAFGIFLMKQFFASIPKEIEEAAKIDGASRFRMFFQVILPMARPALAALAIFSFQGTWNGFVDPLIIAANNQDIWTLPLGLAFLTGIFGEGFPFNALLAGALLTILPMAVIFIIFQRQFIQGISYTGLKG